MTDNLSALQDFLADTDIDALRLAGLESHGVDILGVYDLHTGRQVGTFDHEVIQFAIDEESIDDEEQLIDALVVRVVASMRPSPALNKPDRVTLLNLAAKHPVDILSYLANRLNSNRYLATRRTELFAPYIGRITLHSRWMDLVNKGVDTRPWIHWLLELDAKENLHDISPPQIGLDRENRLIITNDGLSLFHFVTVDNQLECLAAFEKWAWARLKAYEERDKRITAQHNASYVRGNSLSQPAYSRSWLDNPEIANKKRAAQMTKKQKAANPTKPVSEKQQKLNNRVAMFMGLLEEVLDGKIESPAPAKPAAKMLTAGSLFAKKES